MVRRYLDLLSPATDPRAASRPAEQSSSSITQPMRPAATEEPRQPTLDTPRSEPEYPTQSTTSALMSETAAQGESEFYAKGEKEIPKSSTGVMEALKTTSFPGCPGVNIHVETDAIRNMLSNLSQSKDTSMSMSVEFDAYKPIQLLISTPKSTISDQPFALQSELDRPRTELVRTMNIRESATLVVKTPNGWFEEDHSLIPSTLHLYNEDGSRVGRYSAWSPAQVSPGYQFAPSLGEWKRPRAAERQEVYASRKTRGDPFLAAARDPERIADPEFHERDLASIGFANTSELFVTPTTRTRQLPWVELQVGPPILPSTRSQPSKISYSGTSRERAPVDLAPFCVNMNSSMIKAAVAGACSSQTSLRTMAPTDLYWELPPIDARTPPRDDATATWLEDWIAATYMVPNPELSVLEKCGRFDWIAADLSSRGAYIEALLSGHEHFAPRCYTGEAGSPMDWIDLDRETSKSQPHLCVWERGLFQVGVDMKTSRASIFAEGNCKADAVDLRNEEMAQLRFRQPRLPEWYARPFGGYNTNNNEHYFIDCKLLGCLECTLARREQILPGFISMSVGTGAKSVTKAFHSGIASGEAQEGDPKNHKNENTALGSYTRLKIQKPAVPPPVAKSQWDLIEESVARNGLRYQPFFECGTKRRPAEIAEKTDISNLPAQPQELPSSTPLAAICVNEGPRGPREEEVEDSTHARPFSTPQLALEFLTKDLVLKSPQGAERNGIPCAQSSYQSLHPPTQGTAITDENALESAEEIERDSTSGYSHFISQFHSTIQDGPLPEEQDAWETCEEESMAVAKSPSAMKQDLELGVRKIALETARRAERARIMALCTQSPQTSAATQEDAPPAPSQTPWKRKLVKFADEVEAKDTKPKYPLPASDRLAITYILMIGERLYLSFYGSISTIKKRVLKMVARLPAKDVLAKTLGRYILIAIISSAPIGFMAIAFAAGFATHDCLSKASESGTSVAITNTKPALLEDIPSALSEQLNSPLTIIRCILGSLGFFLLVGYFSTTAARTSK